MTTALAAALAVAMALGACGATDDGAGSSTTPDTSAATTTSTSAPSTTTTSTIPRRPPRALGLVVAAPQPIPADGDGTIGADAGPTSRSMADLQVGDCVQLGALLLDDAEETTSTEVGEVAVSPCDEPHDAEIYALISLDDDPASRHPGDEHVIAAADRVCLDAFAPYVGARYVDTRLEIVHLRPTVASWARGDRRVMCMVVNAGTGPLVGSVEGRGAGAP